MQRRMLGAVAGASLLGGVLTGCETVPPSGWAIELASINGAGTDGANADTQITDISADGTKILLYTHASNLGPTDTNGYADVYMRDLTNDTTTLISRNAAGTDATTGGEGTFSPDGTKVAFVSNASDLGPADPDNSVDLYVRDLVSGMVTRIKPAADPCGPAHSSSPVFSPDGTKLAFVYDWWEQIPPSGDHAMDIFVHDFVAGTTTLATPHAGGASCTAGFASYHAVFSPDSSQLAFFSEANDLGPHDSGIPGDFSDVGDIYLRDLVDNTTSLVSVDAAGTEAVNKGSGPPAFTPDGAEVMFRTKATGLGANDTNNIEDVYLRDLAAGTTELVSVDIDGLAGGGTWASISPDGTKIAFQSRGNNFGHVDTDPPHLFADYDIYVRDLAGGVTTLASANADGTDSANNVAAGPQWVGNDRVAFGSLATDLVAGGADDADIFVRDLAAETTTLVTGNKDGIDSDEGGAAMVWFKVPRSGSAIGFQTPASDFGPNDTNGFEDVYVARYHQHADLALSVDATPAEVPSGGEVTVTIEVAASGPDPSVDARVGLKLPAGAKLVGSTGDCDSMSSAPPVVGCRLGDLAPGESASVEVTLSLTGAVGSELTTLVQVLPTTLDLNGSDNSQEIVTTIADG